ncbi:MAG TPA: tetratricopeptide repeat protein [Candidatus Acidoferrum sp.]|nr:tetratricopeptide repeat protein [Candidatus Acidoferrum sp.]
MKARSQRILVHSGIYAVLTLVTLATYLPLWHYGFVDYDDQQYVTDNPRVQAGLTWKGLVWAFGFHAGNWHPLAWLSHMADCQLYGAWAGGHHLTSLLLHVASTLLLFSALNRMTGAHWCSAAVAALFAWHPLHVESVAWVAERKDVLCAFFWMLTLCLYARYATRPSVARYLSTLGSFALCLMSKPMGVTLPCVLLLLDYWPLKRFTICDLRFAILRLLREKIPFLILSAAACALTLCAQQLAIVSTAGLPLPERLLHALAAYQHYLAATLIPRHLAVYYPYQIDLPATVFWSAGLVLGAISFLAIKNLRRRPYLGVGWSWYLVTLVPVIGLVQVGDQAWADRYTYLPLIGPFIMLVWGVSEICRSRIALTLVSVGVAGALLTATTIQLRYWKSTRALFEHANQATPENYLAVTLLGSELAKEGKLNEAIEYYQTALRCKPTFPEAHFFLGNALDEQGKLDEAIAEYQQALWFRPTQEQTHIFMAMALAKQKKYDAAIAHYQAALALNPEAAVAHNNLARLYHTLGRPDDAIEHYQAALEIDPKLALAHNNLGILLLQQGNLSGGTSQLREALRLNPTNSETRLNLAQALNQQEQWAEAAQLFSKSLRKDWPDPKAHYEYAVALAHEHKTREAMGQYAAALLLQPDFPDALDGLSWILATAPNADYRNGTEAVRMSERACELTGRKAANKMKTLAAAYAEAGGFAQAISTVRTAMDLAANSQQAALSNQCRLMIDQFQKSQPWREP